MTDTAAPTPESESTPVRSVTLTPEDNAAVELLLSEHDPGAERRPFAVLTDEEIYAYVEDPDLHAPQGLWFYNLSEEAQQAAAAAAVRSLSLRGLVEVVVENDEVGYELDTLAVSALALRRLDAQLSIRSVSAAGSDWFLLRHVRDEVWMRETVSSAGFHSFTLTRLDEAERRLYLEALRATPELGGPTVSTSVTEAQLEAGTADLAFLEDVGTIGALVVTPLDGTSAETLMVNVLNGGKGVVTGEIDGSTVHYRGGSGAGLLERWDAWVASLGEAAGTGLDGAEVSEDADGGSRRTVTPRRGDEPVLDTPGSGLGVAPAAVDGDEAPGAGGWLSPSSDD